MFLASIEDSTATERRRKSFFLQYTALMLLVLSFTLASLIQKELHETIPIKTVMQFETGMYSPGAEEERVETPAEIVHSLLDIRVAKTTDGRLLNESQYEDVLYLLLNHDVDLLIQIPYSRMKFAAQVKELLLAFTSDRVPLSAFRVEFFEESELVSPVVAFQVTRKG